MFFVYVYIETALCVCGCIISDHLNYAVVLVSPICQVLTAECSLRYFTYQCGVYAHRISNSTGEWLYMYIVVSTYRNLIELAIYGKRMCDHLCIEYLCASQQTWENYSTSDPICHFVTKTRDCALSDATACWRYGFAKCLQPSSQSVNFG